MSDTTSAAPSDAEIGDLCDQFRWDTAEGRRACARAVLAKWGTPQPVANQAPAPSFDDPRVQVVYSTICDDADWPPNGAPQQHWEGWIARRIVERLDACKPVAREPLTADDIRQPKNGQWWRVEWWNESCRMLLPKSMRLDSFQSYKNGTLMFTIKQAAHGIGTEKGDSHE